MHSRSEQRSKYLSQGAFLAPMTQGKVQSFVNHPAQAVPRRALQFLPCQPDQVPGQRLPPDIAWPGRPGPGLPQKSRLVRGSEFGGAAARPVARRQRGSVWGIVPRDRRGIGPP